MAYFDIHFSFCFVNRNLQGSRDSAVGIVTRRRLNGRGIVVPFLVGARPNGVPGGGGSKFPPPRILQGSPKPFPNRSDG